MTLRAACIAIAVLGLAVSVAGCEQEGPAERAGKKLDEAVEQAGEDLERAGKELDEAAREAGEKLEEAGEKLQEQPDR